MRCIMLLAPFLVLSELVNFAQLHGQDSFSNTIGVVKLDFGTMQLAFAGHGSETITCSSRGLGVVFVY